MKLKVRNVRGTIKMQLKGDKFSQIKAKHTPRPNAYERHAPGFVSRNSNCTDGDVRLCSWCSAAPELLQAAKKALQAIDPTGESRHSEVGGPMFLAAKALRLAIAKAQDTSR